MHSVRFINQENSWKNALPLGNGVMGAMAFFQNNCLSLPMNHYEIYYNISDAVLPKDILAVTPEFDDPGAAHRETVERAGRNQPQEGEPFLAYHYDKAKENAYAVAGFSGSYPATGELRFELEDELAGQPSELRLDIEQATVRLQTGTLEVDTFIARQDLMVNTVRGRGVRAIHLEYPANRDREYPDISFAQIDSHTVCWTVTIKLSEEKPFRFAGILRVAGAEVTLDGTTICLKNGDSTFTVLTGIFTEWNYASPLEEGLAKMAAYEAGLSAITAQHQAYWQAFFDRSGICLPDKFLEKVYYINQYALDCSSGKDGIMKHHACGLNGLWDIRHPNLWGSMWYWDVNIQAAFAGVFSSNRLDLGKVFSDGLRTYVELAERYAKNMHGMNGAAIDYPYHFYYSTWPWCAQYLWSQYEYSLDKEYLKNDAYPVFLKLCRFATELFYYDEQRGEYVVYPDVSPEQGPLTHNSVITVASVKYMLKFTLEAAEILDDHDPLLEDIRRLYEHMPAYPTVTDDYGTRLLDSEDAPANMWIRHPSLLMPIFPTGEIDMDSDQSQKDMVLNTLRFLETHCEIGVFQVSWLAAVSARMGDGQRALRLLYEMGMDHLLRSNGLAAEENERFMNYCLIMRQPLYYPCMMEFTGEMLAAVNEMLMQSNGGIIRVFPAMPTGDRELDRMIRRGYSLHEFKDRFNEYPAWKDVRFDKLLARGAVEVSAELRNGQVQFIRILSRKGGKVRITSPYCLAAFGANEQNILELDTQAGQEYTFGTYTARPCVTDDAVDTHLTYTKRRIFIGENEDTAYQRSLDSFTRDWYLGNARMSNHNVYKFDFGFDYQKDYAKELPRQTFGTQERLLGTMGYNRLDTLPFTTLRGFGFAAEKDLQRVDRGGPDLLRQDFVEGSEPNEFWIEAPAGQYELFVVSGDAQEDSITKLSCSEGITTGGKQVRAGQYQCKVIPVIHEQDGPIRLQLSTEPGSKWKLNLILMNLYKQF